MINTILKLIITIILLGLVCEISHAQESDSTSIDESDKFGYLQLSVTDQDSFYVVINNRFDEAMEIASGDSIELEAGRIHFRIVKRYYMDVQRFVTIEANKTKKVGTNLIQVRGDDNRGRRSSYPRLFWEGNNFVLSDPNTDLYIDGEYTGTQYVVVDTTREFEIRGVHPSGKEFSASFMPDGGVSFNLHQRYVKPSRSKARALSMLPGGSQFYKGQRLRAIAVSLATLGGAALAYSYETRYQDSMDTYNRLNIKYKSSRNPEEAYVLGNEAEEAYSESVSLAKTRNRFIYGTALVYVANIIDGFIAPSIGYRNKNRTINPYLDFDPAYKQPVIGVKSNF